MQKIDMLLLFLMVVVVVAISVHSFLCGVDNAQTGEIALGRPFIKTLWCENRAPDIRGKHGKFRDNVSGFSTKPYIMIPH